MGCYVSEHVYINTPRKNDNKTGSNQSAISQKVRMNPSPLIPDVMLLQRTIGNQAVIQLFKDIGLIKDISKSLQRKALPEEKKMKKENKTGLPDNLKAGVESLSGLSLDEVKVHYNSSKPAELRALAYTQGRNIHVAEGQESHLPHETWHVVQQIQGRVKPTKQFNGMAVNDNSELELEASEMGKKALNTFPQQAANHADKYVITEHLSASDAKTSSAVHQLCPPRRAAFERNPFSHPPSRYGPPSQSSMHLRNPRPCEGQRLEYTGNLLWDGFRSGRYPTTFNPETIEAVYQGNPQHRCPGCGELCTRGINAQIDHITPFFQYVDEKADRNAQEEIGGVTWYGYLKTDINMIYNDIANLRILCNSCNAKKGGQFRMPGYQPSTNPAE